MKYIVTYIDKNLITNRNEKMNLLIENGRNCLLATIRDMKKHNIQIIEVLRVNRNEIYTPIKF